MRITISVLLFALLGCHNVQAAQVIEQKKLDELVREAEAAFNRQDFGKAYEDFDRAARWGHKGAQFVLGNMYLMGKGTARDPVAGAAWLAVASESGIPGYEDAAKNSSTLLTRDEKSAARKLESELSLHFGLEAAQVNCQRQRPPGSNFYATRCRHTAAGHGLIFVPDEADVDSIASP